MTYAHISRVQQSLQSVYDELSGVEDALVDGLCAVDDGADPTPHVKQADASLSRAATAAARARALLGGKS